MVLTDEQIRKEIATKLSTIASWLDNSATRNEDIEFNCEEVIAEATRLASGAKSERELVDKMGSIVKVFDEVYGKLHKLAFTKRKYGNNYQTWPDNVLYRGIGSDKYYKPEHINKVVSVAVKLSEFLKETSRNHHELRENYVLFEFWTNYQQKVQERMSVEVARVQVEL